MCADPSLFAAVFAEHHQALYRYCRSIVAHDEDAQDALQNTMTRAFAALGAEQRDFELRPWLFRIAHNESISLIRARRPTAGLDAAADAGADTLERDLTDRSELAMLRADLGDLPEAQRAALVMRELSGLSHDEMAVALDRPAASVKQLIYEARASLHACREGRALACDAVRRVISDDDGRALRGRALRAHLRACPGCRDFAAAIKRRPEQLAAMAPPLPVALSGALLAGLVPSGKAAAAGFGATSAASSGALGAKIAVSVVLAAGAASGAATIVRQHPAPAGTAPAVSAPGDAGPTGRSSVAGRDFAAPTVAGADHPRTGRHRRIDPIARPVTGSETAATGGSPDAGEPPRQTSAEKPAPGTSGRHAPQNRPAGSRPGSGARTAPHPRRSRKQPATPTRRTPSRRSVPAAKGPLKPPVPARSQAPANDPRRAAPPARTPAKAAPPASPPAAAQAAPDVAPSTAAQPPSSPAGRSTR